ncbi:MAG: M28 family peptidase [Chloroflexota bacterium]
MNEAELLQMEKDIVGTIWTSDNAYETLRELCDEIGHRFGGSESEKAGAEFLANKMKEYGLENVRIEEFPMATWERGEAKMTLLEPVERDISCISLPYCPAANLEGELLDVGDGEEDDFERLGDQVRGKIVISAAETNRPGERGSHRTDKYRWAHERGAIGYIYVNQNPGLLRITGSLRGRNPQGDTAEDREAPIPAVGVSFESGSLILRMMKRGTGKVKLELDNRTYMTNSRNVIGEIPGSEKPEEVILLGGHFDGHDVAQGAGDDGAGAITGLEVGRALAPFKGKLKRTVRIICFGSEELGLLGAWHHAEQTDPDSYRFVMNLDGAGRGQGGHERLVLSGWDDLKEYFENWADEHHYNFEIINQLNSHSDHFPFAVRGIPNGTLNSVDATAGMIGRGWGHTEADTFDKIHPRGLQMAAALVARIAATLAQDDEYPAKRRSIDEVREQLEEEGLLERVEASGQFPPA